jgi:hypothetical protein
MDTTEERLSNRKEVDGMDMTGKYVVVDTEERLLNRTKVKGIDLGWVERVHDGVVMPQHSLQETMTYLSVITDECSCIIEEYRLYFLINR